jgi:type I restriction enzyme M protein
VDAYQFRKEETRYSRRVSMAEIEQNGYGLNISRYVSMATKEEAIDLNVVHQQLVEISRKAEEARAKHNEFLKELGLPLI